MTSTHDTVAVPGSVPESLGEVIAARVRACPGVLELNGGGLAPIATYLPGRRVVGVRLDEERILVGVTLARGANVPRTAQAIRAGLADLADGRPVDVHVADVQDSVVPQ